MSHSFVLSSWPSEFTPLWRFSSALQHAIRLARLVRSVDHGNDGRLLLEPAREGGLEEAHLVGQCGGRDQLGAGHPVHHAGADAIGVELEQTHNAQHRPARILAT